MERENGGLENGGWIHFDGWRPYKDETGGKPPYLGEPWFPIMGCHTTEVRIQQLGHCEMD